MAGETLQEKVAGETLQGNVAGLTLGLQLHPIHLHLVERLKSAGQDNYISNYEVVPQHLLLE